MAGPIVSMGWRNSQQTRMSGFAGRADEVVRPGDPRASRLSSARERRYRPPSQLPCGLEQLDRVPVGVLDLNLFAARSRFHFVPETKAGALQRLDERRKIVDAKHHTVPPARFL